MNPVQLGSLIVDGDAAVDPTRGILKMDPSVKASSIDAGLTANVGATHIARDADVGGALTTLLDKNLASSRSVSGTHVSQAIVVDLRNLATSLSIHMAASGGTATLLVEASVDNSNFIQADSISAAQFTVKVYGPTTAGAAAAAAAAGPIAPLSFRYVRITAGDAGVGNTTTLTIAAK